jgi:arsenate reductase
MSAADALTIYHNPNCTTSRKTLAAIQEAGRAVTVVEYMKTGWTREVLDGLLKAMDARPSDILRRKQTLTQDLGLDRPEASDEEILAAMILHPVLVERPIVSGPKGAAVCRPMDRVRAFL